MWIYRARFQNNQFGNKTTYFLKKTLAVAEVILRTRRRRLYKYAMFQNRNVINEVHNIVQQISKRDEDVEKISDFVRIVIAAMG